MNVRLSGYDDYNITEQEKQQIIEQAQSGGIDLQTVLECAIESNPGLAKELFCSIVYRISFEKLDQINCVPALKVDFYAYRRKTIALIRDRLKGIQTVKPERVKSKSNDIEGQTSIYDWMPDACPKEGKWKN